MPARAAQTVPPSPVRASARMPVSPPRPLIMSESERWPIIHALRVAGEKFSANAKDLRSEARRLIGTSETAYTIRALEHLAEQVDFQATRAFGDATRIEDAEQITIIDGLPDAQEVQDDEDNERDRESAVRAAHPDHDPSGRRIATNPCPLFVAYEPAPGYCQCGWALSAHYKNAGGGL